MCLGAIYWAHIDKIYYGANQLDAAAVDDVDGSPRAHIHHFHIVVGVLREVDETGMGTDGDELSGSEQFAAVDGSFLALHVNIPVDIISAV
jgi:hypothetical protein